MHCSVEGQARRFIVCAKSLTSNVRNIVTFWEAHITRLSHEGIKHASAREILIFLAEESFKQEGSNRHVFEKDTQRV